ncbi:MAG: tetratricopeptide repeat protein, partial [Cyanobacteria bacterium J06560_2]
MLSQEQPLPKERRPKNSPEGPSKNKAQPADSDVALTNDPVSAPTIAQLQSAIIAALHQAHTDTQSGEWLQVMTVCETIISRCVQCNELSAQKSVPDNTLSAAAMYRAKGQVLLEKGQLPTAIESLEQSLQHKNDQVDVHEDLARLYSQSQQWTQAIHHYEYLLSAVPDNSAALVQDAIAQAWAHSAQSLKQSGEIHSAVRAYLTALKYQPRLYMAYNRLRYNLMRYDIAEGDPILGEVVETISAIVSEHPGLKSAEVALGYALTRLGRLDEATDCYLQASEQSTRRQIAQRNYLLSDLARQDRARPDSVQAVELLAARQQPAFLVIGAEKSGTTSLYQYLSSHPQLLSPIEKEIDFFDAEYSRGLDWYLAHFPAVCQKNGEPSSFI